MAFNFIMILDSIIILYGSLSVTLLFLFTYVEAYQSAKKISIKYRNFIMTLVKSAIVVSILDIVYFSLRMHQWTLGLYNYIVVDFLVASITTLLYMMTYPFFVDKIRELEILYKLKL